MTDYIFSALGLHALDIHGPNPFDTDAATQLSIRAADWHDVTIRETRAGSGRFHLAAPVRLNGTWVEAGADLRLGKTLTVRDVEADPADTFALYAIEIDGALHGITAARPLPTGLRLDVLDEHPFGGLEDADSDKLLLCFAPGTMIDTPDGPRAVETLRDGDLVTTLETGAQPVAWVGAQDVCGTGAMAPVQVGAGLLRNAAPLLMSPDHRVLLSNDLGVALPGDEEHLLPVKGLLGLPGVELMPHLRIRYHHIALSRHEVIRANGAWVESFLPGPAALRNLSQRDRARFLMRFPELRGGGAWEPARPLLKPARFERLVRGQGITLDDSFEDLLMAV